MRWDFDRLWPAIRDVASWGLGAWWGNLLMTAEGPADPVRVALVAGLLGLPFVFRADEIRRKAGPGPPSTTDPPPLPPAPPNGAAPSPERAEL